MYYIVFTIIVDRATRAAQAEHGERQAYKERFLQSSMEAGKQTMEHTTIQANKFKHTHTHTTNETLED